MIEQKNSSFHAGNRGRAAQERRDTININTNTNIIPGTALKVNLNLDSKPYYSKADAVREYGKIRTRLCNRQSIVRDFDLARLPVTVSKGFAFTPAVMTGTTGDTWQSQQIFCADIDNEDGGTLTPDDAVEIMAAAGIAPSFIYYSFSHTEERPRFRVVVAADREITNPQQADRMRKGLISLFPGSDNATADPARMFQGTNKGIAVEYTGATVAPEALEALYYERVEPKQPEITQTHRPIFQADKSNNLTLEIENFDLAAYVSSTTNSIPKQIGGQVRFNPCPLCGHKDDFDVRGSVFTCRSSHGLNGGGGNIINYLEEKNGWSRQQAREYFMYDILKWDRIEHRQKYREQKRVERVQRVTQAPASQEVPDFVIVKTDKNGEIVKMYISCPKLAQAVREHERFIFVKDSAMSDVRRFWYSGGYYRHVSDDEIRGFIRGYVDRFDPDLVKMRDIDEVFRLLSIDSVFHSFEELNDENLICFRDCVLDLRTWKPMPHSPEYLLTRQIPVDYNDPRAKDEPTVFHRYMARLCWGRDEYIPPFDGPGAEKYVVLMQFLAVAMSNIKGYRFKKSLFLYGDGNTGKSQIRSLGEFLVGSENCCSIDLATLESRFGSSTIFNKRLIGSGDMPFMTVSEMSTFKQVTGGDSIFAEFKGKNGFSFTFDGLSWFCTNRLPKFGGDHGQWVYDRILPVHCLYVVPEELRDPHLLDRMKSESPAIVRELVGFLHGIVKDGKYQFTEPTETIKIREDYHKNNDTLAAWIDEYCVIVDNPGDEWPTVIEWKEDHDAPSMKTLYKLYKEWCREYENNYCLKFKDFKNEIFARFDNTPEKEKRRSGFVFTSICLKNEYKSKANLYNAIGSASA